MQAKAEVKVGAAVNEVLQCNAMQARHLANNTRQERQHKSPFSSPKNYSITSIVKIPWNEMLSLTTNAEPEDTSLDMGYPTPHVVLPLSGEHNHTLILLHGTSTSGPEFADTFLSFPFPSCTLTPSNHPPTTSLSLKPETATTTTLQKELPNIKIIFPTGKPRKTTVFNGRVTNAWFDIHDFSDRMIGEAEQIIGMRESTAYLVTLIKHEIQILENLGQGGKLVIGGFSQGAAMSAILLLRGMLQCEGLDGKVAGLVLMSGWLPFRRQVVEAFSSSPAAAEKRERATEKLAEILGFERKERNEMDTPVFMAHGGGDRKVRIEWGREMRDVFVELSLNVRAEEGEGWEEEGLGHWYGREGMDGLVRFLGVLGVS